MLWSAVLLASLAAGMTTSGRGDVLLAGNLRAAAGAEAAADGAVFEAGFHLLDPASPWAADGRPIAAARRGATVTVCIVNEAGKINPNTASPGLLAALLRVVGVEGAAADRLSLAVYDWRSGGDRSSMGGSKLAPYQEAGLAYGPPGTPFTELDGLRSVVGMTPELFRRVAPYLTLWSDGEPDPHAASPVVLAALQSLIGLDPRANTTPARPTAVAVTAVAQIGTGARFIRRAALRLTPADPAPVRVLTWEEADAAPACR